MFLPLRCQIWMCYFCLSLPTVEVPNLDVLFLSVTVGSSIVANYFIKCSCLREFVYKGYKYLFKQTLLCSKTEMATVITFAHF